MTFVPSSDTWLRLHNRVSTHVPQSNLETEGQAVDVPGQKDRNFVNIGAESFMEIITGAGAVRQLKWHSVDTPAVTC